VWWRELEPGVWTGHGVREDYLVWYDTADGQVKLTRWERQPTCGMDKALEVRDAVTHLVSQQVSRGPGRPPMLPDAEHAMTLARMQADMFDSGHSLGKLNRPDWVYPPSLDLGD